jgi:hypothetical protein
MLLGTIDSAPMHHPCCRLNQPERKLKVRIEIEVGMHVYKRDDEKGLFRGKIELHKRDNLMVATRCTTPNNMLCDPTFSPYRTALWLFDAEYCQRANIISSPLEH